MPRTKRQLTPQTLFDYATTFCKTEELAGNGSCYPTFREAARYFRVKLSDIQQACDDWQGEGYMQAGVGGRTGQGHYPHEAMGEYQVEAYA